MLRKVTVVFAALACFVVSQPTHATKTQIIGGPGGAGFTLECPAGQSAVGISARAGSWVDAVAVLCKTPAGGLQQTDWTGGPNGSPQEIYCPPGEEISGAFFTFTRGNDLPKEFVNTVGIVCGTTENTKIRYLCILSGDTYKDQLLDHCYNRAGWGSVGADLKVPADYVECPAGEVLTGLHGRSWKYLDAIGVICGPREGSTAIAPAGIGQGAAEQPYVIGDRLIRTSPSSAVVGASGVEHSPVIKTSPSSAVVGASSAGHSAVIPDSAVPMLGQLGTCKSGFVWREAGPGDYVCVQPGSRDRARVENELAETRRDPASGYGPIGCKAGFVWREAFQNDLVCVDPAVRDLVREENALASTRMR